MGRSEDIVLDRLKFRLVQLIDAELLSGGTDVEISRNLEFMSNRLAVAITREVLRHKRVRDTFQIERSPWQAWKAAHAPRWFRRLFPVRYREVPIAEDALFPRLPVAYPPSLGQVVFRQYVNEEAP